MFVESVAKHLILNPPTPLNHERYETMNVASLQIDPALIKDITEKTVQTQIVSALGDPGLLIRTVVAQVLKVKVNSNGVRSNSDYENRYNLIETLAAKSIREKCQQIINEYIEANSDEIRAAAKREMVQVAAMAIKFLAMEEK
jgi:hypothetical protein